MKKILESHSGKGDTLILVMDEEEIGSLEGKDLEYKGEEIMEEGAFCKGCNTWSGWFINRGGIVCLKCGTTYTWPLDCTDGEATKAQDIIDLVNKNH